MKASSAPTAAATASPRPSPGAGHASVLGSAALSYTLPESRQNLFVRVVGGASVNADRLSAYRLGGFLPLITEYPLSLPGYYFQELSARNFALINASYLLPIAPDQRWNLEFNGATADIDYLSGTEQAGNWVSGVGAGILYRAPSDRFKCVVAYAMALMPFVPADAVPTASAS
jgi:hypothetical protein